MSSDTEHQQVVVALMDETEKPSIETVNQKQRPSKKNYCTEEYLVPYGVPIFVILLIIILVILAIIYIRMYNRNCQATKGASCRGILWYFN